MTWQVVYANAALKDAKKIAAAGFKTKVQALIGILEADPLQKPPPYEKLVGDLSGWKLERVRQNLGLVVALQGRFDEAEQIVRADLPPAEAAMAVDDLRRMIEERGGVQRTGQPSNGRRSKSRG